MGEINFAYNSGKTLYAIIKDSLGKFYNSSSHLFENMSSSNWGTYAIPMTELGAATGQYTASMPTFITTSGIYTIDVYKQAGGSVTLSADIPPVGTGDIHWNGKFLAEISLADLIGAPAIFGKVLASPAPTTTTFRVMLDRDMAAGATAAAFQGMYLTCMPGGYGGPPFGQNIQTCTINAANDVTLTLYAPLPVAPAINDQVAISE